MSSVFLGGASSASNFPYPSGGGGLMTLLLKPQYFFHVRPSGCTAPSRASCCCLPIWRHLVSNHGTVSLPPNRRSYFNVRVDDPSSVLDFQFYDRSIHLFKSPWTYLHARCYLNRCVRYLSKIGRENGFYAPLRELT